jgi:hypothetical protein
MPHLSTFLLPTPTPLNRLTLRVRARAHNRLGGIHGLRGLRVQDILLDVVMEHGVVISYVKKTLYYFLLHDQERVESVELSK